MKLFLTLLILFSSSIFASDISSLKINNIGLFENLSAHYSKQEIKKNIEDYKDYYAKFGYDTTFVEISWWTSGDYDAMAFWIKPDDPTFTIWGINGKIKYKNFKTCLNKKMKEEEKILEKFFNAKTNVYNGPHNLDSSGKSYVESSYFKLNSGIHIEISCYDFDKSMQLQGDNYDHFGVYIDSKELSSFLGF